MQRGPLLPVSSSSSSEQDHSIEISGQEQDGFGWIGGEYCLCDMDQKKKQLTEKKHKKLPPLKVGGGGMSWPSPHIYNIKKKNVCPGWGHGGGGVAHHALLFLGSDWRKEVEY